MTHASMTELTPKELVAELKEIYSVLASLGSGEALEAVAPSEEVEELTEAVKETTDTPESDRHGKICRVPGVRQEDEHAEGPPEKGSPFAPKDYYRRYGLDPKNFPLVCKDYSEKRRQLAIDNGFGELRKRKVAEPAIADRKDFKVWPGMSDLVGGDKGIAHRTQISILLCSLKKQLKSYMRKLPISIL